jgi:hypothetical protein
MSSADAQRVKIYHNAIGWRCDKFMPNNFDYFVNSYSQQ